MKEYSLSVLPEKVPIRDDLVGAGDGDKGYNKAIDQAKEKIND